MQTVFSLPDYSVFCGSLREYFPGWLRERRYSKILILADSNTRRLCLPALLSQTGLPADTPVAIVRRGTLPDQKSLAATLGTLPARIASEAIKPPALIVVGTVVGLREQLNWYESAD